MTRVWVAAGLLVVWMGITFLLIPPQDGDVPLDVLVTQGFGRQFVVACLFLIAAVAVLRWGDLGLGAPRPARSVALLWLHAIVIGGMIAVAVAFGLPAPGVILHVFANTMMVGFSEEVMFRGFVLVALWGVMGVWPAVLVSSAIFGVVHVTNGFVTGDWAAATMQAAMATASGLAFAAIRVRTGSLWPGIAAHGLWDFALFLMGQARGPAADPAEAGGMTPWGPLMLVLPFVAYAIWLLRHQSWRREAVAAGGAAP